MLCVENTGQISSDSPGPTINCDVVCAGSLFGGTFNGNVSFDQDTWIIGGGGGTLVFNGQVQFPDGSLMYSEELGGSVTITIE